MDRRLTLNQQCALCSADLRSNHNYTNPHQPRPGRSGDFRDMKTIGTHHVFVLDVFCYQRLVACIQQVGCAALVAHDLHCHRPAFPCACKRRRISRPLFCPNPFSIPVLQAMKILGPAPCTQILHAKRSWLRLQNIAAPYHTCTMANASVLFCLQAACNQLSA